MWEKGARLVRDPDGTPIRAADVTLGSAFHVIPEELATLSHHDGYLEEKAKAIVLMMRLRPEQLIEAEDRKDWSYDGIVAYSKVCTHVGCPVALYEQQTHHLLCPCHQSQFDVTDHAKVIFGPAARPLPQLPITVDDEGLPGRTQRLQGTRRPELLGAPLSTATLSKEDKDTKAPLGGRFVGAASNYIDERTSLSGFVKELGRKIFPDHWSFMLGEIALWELRRRVPLRNLLTFFFQASMVETHYTGAYAPMRGIEMSAALESSLHISFDLRGGLLVRQIHHWAALVFIAASACTCSACSSPARSASRVSSTGFIGFVLFILAMAEGFTGYSLPDDLLSGNGLRIIDGMIKGSPPDRHLDLVPPLRRRVPRHRHRRTSVHAAHPVAADARHRAHRRAPDADDHQQAHAVRRPRPHERQCRGLPR